MMVSCENYFSPVVTRHSRYFAPFVRRWRATRLRIGALLASAMRTPEPAAEKKAGSTPSLAATGCPRMPFPDTRCMCRRRSPQRLDEPEREIPSDWRQIGLSEDAVLTAF